MLQHGCGRLRVGLGQSSSESSERSVRLEPNLRSERVRYFFSNVKRTCKQIITFQYSLPSNERYSLNFVWSSQLLLLIIIINNNDNVYGIIVLSITWATSTDSHLAPWQPARCQIIFIFLILCLYVSFWQIKFVVVVVWCCQRTSELLREFTRFI